MDCIFCKIVSRQIPGKLLYETQNVLAFADIDPKAPFHAVVIPKQHIPNANCVNAKNSHLMADIFEAVAAIARQEDLKDGYRVVMNCGRQGGQTVDHLHFHLLARRDLGWPPG